MILVARCNPMPSLIMRRILFPISVVALCLPTINPCMIIYLCGRPATDPLPGLLVISSGRLVVFFQPKSLARHWKAWLPCPLMKSHRKSSKKQSGKLYYHVRLQPQFVDRSFLERELTLIIAYTSFQERLLTHYRRKSRPSVTHINAAIVITSYHSYIDISDTQFSVSRMSLIPWHPFLFFLLYHLLHKLSLYFSWSR